MSRIHNTGLNIRCLKGVCVLRVPGGLSHITGSRSVSQWYGSADLDLYQNVTDPQHWTKYTWRAVTHLRAALSRPDTWCSHFVPSNAYIHYIHYTSYIVHYTLYNVHCTLYCTLHIVLYIIHYTLYIIHYTLYIIHYALYIIHTGMIRQQPV